MRDEKRGTTEDVEAAVDRRLPHVIPTLRITDYARSRAFYVDRLGFEVNWEHRFEPGLPVFAQITRDGMTLFLTEHRGDCPTGALVHVLVPDVDSWYAELRGRGAEIGQPPSQSLQGVRDMTVVDPDGNKLRFFTRLAEWHRDPPSARGFAEDLPDRRHLEQGEPVARRGSTRPRRGRAEGEGEACGEGSGHG